LQDLREFKQFELGLREEGFRQRFYAALASKLPTKGHYGTLLKNFKDLLLNKEFQVALGNEISNKLKPARKNIFAKNTKSFLCKSLVAVCKDLTNSTDFLNLFQGDYGPKKGRASF